MNKTLEQRLAEFKKPNAKELREHAKAMRLLAEVVEADADESEKREAFEHMDKGLRAGMAEGLSGGGEVRGPTEPTKEVGDALDLCAKRIRVGLGRLRSEESKEERLRDRIVEEVICFENAFDGEPPAVVAIRAWDVADAVIAERRKRYGKAEGGEA